MRRPLALAVALVAVGVAVLVLLLAVDLRRYERALAADDAAFRVDPARESLWEPPQIVPFGAARGLLGVGEQVAYRKAMRLFILGRPRLNVLETTPSIQAYRSEATTALWRLARRDGVARRRSGELNMVGVLDLVSAGPSDPVAWLRALVRASGSFRRAIVADERAAEDAKFNLEVTLRLIQAVRSNSSTLKGLGGSATQTTTVGSGY
jgi:hypothetical protein